MTYILIMYICFLLLYTQIFSHGNNLSSLHQILSREVLPAELGGEQGPYQSSPWMANLQKASHETLDRDKSPID